MSRAAIRYAKAILDTAVASGNAAKVNDDMLSVVDTIAQSRELEHFLASPIITSEIKLNALKEIFTNVQSETNSLFRLLFENKRFEILASVAAQFNHQFDQMNGIEVAYVTTAVEMTSEIEAQVKSKIASISDKKVTVKNIIDPAILGGFILRIGDRQFNASVANRLQELKREFSN
ncbi:ATP synthase F1 subunit delta [Flavobacterium sp. CYK-55]|uniref:ATP synthase F1 subunit delta n=1 Tax=Flavobacterium sp. CYK-55 TaxID=2835529 RepID=UPI001BCB6291|nr:ATP synthase F1 subunit delta [Flavobacterium sp. CYK-55]MBS7787543.1 ATP synthase F1 subunit delta [Flavobacterium sp. CYK-55]